MTLSKIFSIITILAISFFSSSAIAQNHTIDMLNKLGKERMVFSKKVISVKCRFFLAFLPWFYCFLSCCAIACLAFMNCSVLFMERIMSL